MVTQLPVKPPVRTPALTDLVAVPRGLNAGVICPTPQDLEAAFGEPRSSYSSACQPMTNQDLSAHVVFRSVGPFRVTGLKPAVESLARVMSDIAHAQPEVYKVLGSAGMLCCRRQRGSTRVSSHAWGTAIDLTLDGQLDAPGNNQVQYGLTLIAPIFNRHGWFWGASFKREDAMHFEAGRVLIGAWGKQIGPVAGGASLKLGDRGKRVIELQQALNKAGARLKADGVFGAVTESAVRDFQKKHALVVDGIAGPRTLRALGL